MGRTITPERINADKLDSKDSTDFEEIINKGAINGYAPLDINQLLPEINIPDLDGGSF